MLLAVLGNEAYDRRKVKSASDKSRLAGRQPSIRGGVPREQTRSTAYKRLASADLAAVRSKNNSKDHQCNECPAPSRAEPLATGRSTRTVHPTLSARLITNNIAKHANGGQLRQTQGAITT